jgi:CBS domain-containing protein
MKVRECMNRNVFTVAPGASLKEAQKVMQDHGVTHVLVVEKDRLQGILGEDKLKEIESRPALANNAWEREYQFRYKKVEEVMEREPLTTTPDGRVEEILALAQHHQAKVIPVIDEGKVVGTVTRGIKPLITP